MRNAKQVVPLTELKPSDGTGSDILKNSAVDFQADDLTRIQIGHIAKRLLFIVPTSATLTWLVFEVVGWSINGPNGPPTPTDLFASAWVGVAYLVVTFLGCVGLSYFWMVESCCRVEDGHVLALVYRGQRTRFRLWEGTHFLPTNSDLVWCYLRSRDSIEATVAVLLPPPERNRLVLTYFLQWRVARLWDHVDAVNNRAFPEIIERAIQEQLKRHFAVPYDGPLNVREALASYDEVRQLIQDVVASLGPLGISVVECRVLDIDTIRSEPAESGYSDEDRQSSDTP